MNTDTVQIFQSLLLNWYDIHARILPWRDDPSPYRVWISEIMLQQTRVETVVPYFERFVKELPDVQALSAVPEQRLLKLWEGLGYYNRARNLQKAAIEVVNKYGGQLPAEADELKKLSGIGPYSAGAITSIAFGKKTAAIDGNVLRVMVRIFADQRDTGENNVKKDIEEKVNNLLPKERIGDFNQALMELGATVCLPNGIPECEKCPVKTLCQAYGQGIAERLPMKFPKKPRRIEEKTILLILCGSKTAVRQRPDKGLLSGLWEFPNVDGNYTEQQCIQLLRNWGISIAGLEILPKAKHIFTHIEWHMSGFLIKAVQCQGGELTWATVSELKQRISIPSAFKTYLKILEHI